MLYSKVLLGLIASTLVTNSLAEGKLTLTLNNYTNRYMYVTLYGKKTHKCLRQVDRFYRVTINPKTPYASSMNISSGDECIYTNISFTLLIQLCESGGATNCKTQGHLVFSWINAGTQDPEASLTFEPSSEKDKNFSVITSSTSDRSPVANAKFNLSN